MKQIQFAISLLSLVVFIGSSCSPKAKTIHGLKGMIASGDCAGPCGKKMPCEGEERTIEMTLGDNNVLISSSAIFVRDPDNYDYTLRIDFTEAVPSAVYSDARNEKYKRLVATGIVEGFDQYVHETCTRSYLFKVNDPSKFKLLEH
ncbi:MAG: hypothetical protein IPQ10_01755 [Saprospiraceae bacterium]|jgi:hypothetical protein|nr:hypothetical protein [Saprospiraceae bacterium]MBK7796828.1 hypothetical protein [Saprospiraceae bacterium]MBK9378517.1 hypothetical protein [Saprospiraceae bacterium]MBL0259793.1 hypothetical protein [Saprospiraceae bacterium]MBX7162219.1 hypothetical protein [Saprospiraceae bacterium]